AVDGGVRAPRGRVAAVVGARVAIVALECRSNHAAPGLARSRGDAGAAPATYASVRRGDAGRTSARERIARPGSAARGRRGAVDGAALVDVDLDVKLLPIHELEHVLARQGLRQVLGRKDLHVREPELELVPENAQAVGRVRIEPQAGGVQHPV